jgi:deoxyribodipyrimidine photo-lyase
VPELENAPDKYVHKPRQAPMPPKNYPEPIVDLAEGRDRTLKSFEKRKAAEP